jgi:hypothetical protein
MREVDGYMYLNLLPGTNWDQVPAAAFDRPWPPNLNGYTTGATPQQMLSAIEKADRLPWPGQPRGLAGQARATGSAAAYRARTQSAGPWTSTSKGGPELST